MSERIFTLFGEEIVPEQLKAVGKSRAKKKTGDKNEADETEQKEEKSAEAADAEEAVTQQPAAEPIIEQKEEAAPIIRAAQPTAIREDVTPVTETPQAAATETPAKKAKAEKKEQDKAKPENLPEDWNDGGKQYFSIGEVADLFKAKTSHIRFWTNEFKIKVRTTRKGDRLYTPDQVREIRAIHHLVKERGFTLTGAKAKMKTQNNMDVETVDLKQSLLQLRNKLMTIKNQLK